MVANGVSRVAGGLNRVASVIRPAQRVEAEPVGPARRTFGGRNAMVATLLAVGILALSLQLGWCTDPPTPDDMITTVTGYITSVKGVVAGLVLFFLGVGIVKLIRRGR